MKGTPSKPGVYWVLPKDSKTWIMFSVWKNGFKKLRHTQVFPTLCTISWTFEDMRILYPFAT